jgi:hypothetical protein
MKISQALEIALTALDHLSNETEDCVGLSIYPFLLGHYHFLRRHV